MMEESGDDEGDVRNLSQEEGETETDFVEEEDDQSSHMSELDTEDDDLSSDITVEDNDTDPFPGSEASDISSDWRPPTEIDEEQTLISDKANLSPDALSQLIRRDTGAGGDIDDGDLEVDIFNMGGEEEDDFDRRDRSDNAQAEVPRVEYTPPSESGSDSARGVRQVSAATPQPGRDEGEGSDEEEEEEGEEDEEDEDEEEGKVHLATVLLDQVLDNTPDVNRGEPFVLTIRLPRLSLIQNITLEAAGLALTGASALEKIEGSREGCIFEEMGSYTPTLGLVKAPQNQAVNYVVGVAKHIRMTLKTSTSVNGDSSDDETKSSTKEPFHVKKIVVNGFALNKLPNASKVGPLLNLASSLQTANRPQDALEANFLCGLALMSARRFLQAAEMFRRAEYQLYLCFVGSDEEPNRVVAQQIIVDTTSSMTLHPAMKKDDQNYDEEKLKEFYKRAAKFNLLCAEVFNQHGQLPDKLIAFHRATQYFLGTPSLPPINVYADVWTNLMTLQPHLNKLLIINLQDDLEPLRQAASRGLEFVLDNMGCSVGIQFPAIVHALLSTYPSQEEPSSRLQDEGEAKLGQQRDGSGPPPMERFPASSAALTDSYLRLFETCYHLVPSFNHQILQSLMSDVLQPHLIASDTPVELKVQLLRMLVLVLRQTNGDVDLAYPLLTQMLSLLTHPDGPLKNACKKFWVTLRTRICSILKLSDIPTMVNWIKVMLNGLSNFEGHAPPNLRNSSEAFIPFLIDFLTDVAKNTVSLSSVEAPFAECGVFFTLVPTLVYLLSEKYIQASHFDQFRRVWICLEWTIEAIPESLRPDINQIVLPILKLSYDMCIDASPSLPLLQAMELLLAHLQSDEALTSFLLDYLRIYCQWIPHSLHDETFQVLKSLLRLTAGSINSDMISLVLLALLDRYTMKSRTHRDSVKFFVSTLMHGDIESSQFTNFESVLNTCLLRNTIPLHVFEHGKGLANKLDSRSYQTQHDLFVERLSFMYLCFQEMEDVYVPFIYSKLEEIANACLALLEHPDAKVRFQSLDIVTYLAQRLHLTIVRRSAEWSPQNDEKQGSDLVHSRHQLLCKVVFEYLQKALGIQHDAELQHSCVLFLKTMFDEILPAVDDDEGRPQIRSHWNARPVKSREGVEEYMNQRFAYILLFWDVTFQLIESPWRNLRKVVISVLDTLASHPRGQKNTEQRKQFESKVMPTLMFLLSNHDWECRLGGISILNSYCSTFILEDLRAGMEGVPLPIWDLILKLQDDWNPSIRNSSRSVLSRACPPNIYQQISRSKEEQSSLRLQAYATQLLSQNTTLGSFLPPSRSTQESTFNQSKRTRFALHDIYSVADYSPSMEGVKISAPPKLWEEDFENDGDFESLEDFTHAQAYVSQAAPGDVDTDTMSYFDEQEEASEVEGEDDIGGLNFEDLGIIDLSDADGELEPDDWVMAEMLEKYLESSRASPAQRRKKLLYDARKNSRSQSAASTGQSSVRVGNSSGGSNVKFKAPTAFITLNSEHGGAGDGIYRPPTPSTIREEVKPPPASTKKYRPKTAPSRSAAYRQATANESKEQAMKRVMVDEDSQKPLRFTQANDDFGLNFVEPRNRVVVRDPEENSKRNKPETQKDQVVTVYEGRDRPRLSPARPRSAPDSKQVDEYPPLVFSALNTRRARAGGSNYQDDNMFFDGATHSQIQQPTPLAATRPNLPTRSHPSRTMGRALSAGASKSKRSQSAMAAARIPSPQPLIIIDPLKTLKSTESPQPKEKENAAKTASDRDSELSEEGFGLDEFETETETVEIYEDNEESEDGNNHLEEVPSRSLTRQASEPILSSSPSFGSHRLSPVNETIMGDPDRRPTDSREEFEDDWDGATTPRTDDVQLDSPSKARVGRRQVEKAQKHSPEMIANQMGGSKAAKPTGDNSRFPEVGSRSKKERRRTEKDTESIDSPLASSRYVDENVRPAKEQIEDGHFDDIDGSDEHEPERYKEWAKHRDGVDRIWSSYNERDAKLGDRKSSRARKGESGRWTRDKDKDKEKEKEKEKVKGKDKSRESRSLHRSQMSNADAPEHQQVDSQFRDRISREQRERRTSSSENSLSKSDDDLSPDEHSRPLRKESNRYYSDSDSSSYSERSKGSRTRSSGNSRPSRRSGSRNQAPSKRSVREIVESPSMRKSRSERDAFEVGVGRPGSHSSRHSKHSSTGSNDMDGRLQRPLENSDESEGSESLTYEAPQHRRSSKSKESRSRAKTRSHGRSAREREPSPDRYGYSREKSSRRGGEKRHSRMRDSSFDMGEADREGKTRSPKKRSRKKSSSSSSKWERSSQSSKGSRNDRKTAGDRDGRPRDGEGSSRNRRGVGSGEWDQEGSGRRRGEDESSRSIRHQSRDEGLRSKPLRPSDLVGRERTQQQVAHAWISDSGDEEDENVIADLSEDSMSDSYSSASSEDRGRYSREGAKSGGWVSRDVQENNSQVKSNQGYGSHRGPKRVEESESSEEEPEVVESSPNSSSLVNRQKALRRELEDLYTQQRDRVRTSSAGVPSTSRPALSASGRKGGDEPRPKASPSRRSKRPSSYDGRSSGK